MAEKDHGRELIERWMNEDFEVMRASSDPAEATHLPDISSMGESAIIALITGIDEKDIETVSGDTQLNAS